MHSNDLSKYCYGYREQKEKGRVLGKYFIILPLPVMIICILRSLLMQLRVGIPSVRNTMREYWNIVIMIIFVWVRIEHLLAGKYILIKRRFYCGKSVQKTIGGGSDHSSHHT